MNTNQRTTVTRLVTVFGLQIFMIAGFLARPSTSAAQDNLKTMVAECIAAQAEKFNPLKLESDAVYSKFANQSSAARDIIRWIEEGPALAEQKRQIEVDRLKARLETLESLKSMTTDESLKDPSATITKIQTKIDDIDDERAIAARPIERTRTELQREFKDREDQLEPVMEALCFEKGQNELTSSLMRSYASFTYSTAQVSGQYKKEEKGSIVCTIRIFLDPSKSADPKLGMLNDKYPIVAKRDTQLEIMVGKAIVEIYSSANDFKKDNLGTTVIGLVDVEKLAGMFE